MQPNGIARTEIDVVDLSVLIQTGLKGIHGVLGVTERGEVGKPVLVGSWLDYVREFGGLLDTSDFPLLCRRALDAGARLKVSRVAHYTDIADSATLVGVKATGKIMTADATPLATYEFQAASIGAWGNTVKVTAAAPVSGFADVLDITVELAGYPSLTQIIRNVKANATVITDADIKDFNVRSKYVTIKTITNNLIAGNVTLTTGAEDTTLIVDADYIGDVVAGNGIHSFDNSADITKIAIPEMAKPTLDAALSAYADDRKDIIALTRTPLGVDGATAVDYREGEGIYSHQPIDSWRTFMFTGDLLVNHPNTGLEVEIPAISDVQGLMSTRDNKNKEWFSFSGSKRGRIRRALGVLFNLGTAARATQASLVDSRGINMVIDHDTFGVVSWGNGTLHRADTLLKHANVAELMIFLTRGLKPLIQSELFDPNDVQTWQNIYRKVFPFMDRVKTGRGISDYLYEGDQDVDTIEDAVINQQADIDAGMYVFNLYVKPITALKYIGVKVAVTNSGVSFEVITETNLD